MKSVRKIFIVLIISLLLSATASHSLYQPCNNGSEEIEEVFNSSL